MNRLCITEAHYANGRLLEVKMGLMDGDTNTWIMQPSATEVIYVVDRIMAGDKVSTIFPAEGQTVLGPEVRVVALSDGNETLDVSGDATVGRRLENLPRY